MAVLGRVPPKFKSPSVPHSPFWKGFNRSQSGWKLRLASVQDRLTVVAMFVTGLLSCALAPSAYLATLTLTAVFPVPKRSYTAPILGVRSL
jgi:hypothetical protein